LARGLKLRHPACVVIAGGPEPDYKDPSFFTNHLYIDAVAVKDGEITFTRVLADVIDGDLDLARIPGLFVPASGPASEPVTTGPAEVPTVFDYSPYVDQASYYRELVADRAAGDFDAIVETNRGCPYGCSYCDWGSNTMSKVRRFDMARLEAEARFLGELEIGRIMLADANFGLLPRDLDIADMWIDERARQGGYPQYIFWSAAKNHPARVTEIAQKFASSGLCTSHALSIQHTSRSVLAATERSNISPDKQVQVVKAMMRSHVPVEVQLILGIPGDDYPTWKRCMSDLMSWGIHEDYLIQAYRLLPNAPAADPAFIDHWRVETIERYMHERYMHDHLVRDMRQPARTEFEKPERVVLRRAANIAV